jgi:hypothetical protein
MLLTKCCYFFVKGVDLLVPIPFSPLVCFVRSVHLQTDNFRLFLRQQTGKQPNVMRII